MLNLAGLRPEKTRSYRQLHMTKRILAPRRFIKPTFEFLIEKKRDGGEFSQEEIRYIIDSTLENNLPDHQLSALLLSLIHI